MSACVICGVRLTTDEIAIYLKLVTRTATEFACLDCLSVQLKCGRKDLEDRISYFKESGKCALFR